MLMIRHNHSISFEFLLWSKCYKEISFKTSNKLAVLNFEGYAISEPIIEHLTEELRQSIRVLKIFNVQNKDITNDVNILS